MRVFLILSVLICVSFPATAQDWPTYRSKQFGLSIAYPGHLVDYDASRPARGEFALKGGGFLILTADDLQGQALRPFVRDSLLKNIDVTYERRKNNWMAYSGYAGSEIVYGRSQLSCRGRYAHSFLIRYPRSQRGTYDRVVERLSHSLKTDPKFAARHC